MVRLAPTKETIRSLFAKSGNRCFFPGCPKILIDENETLISEVCHIESVEPNGARYNPGQTDEERRSLSNLLVLCGEHHTLIDGDEVKFSTSVVKKIKSDHESKHGRNIFQLDGSLLFKITAEIDVFWAKVETIQKNAEFDQMLKIEKPTSIEEGFAEIRNILKNLWIVFDWIEKSDNSIEADVKEAIAKCGGNVGFFE